MDRITFIGCQGGCCIAMSSKNCLEKCVPIGEPYHVNKVDSEFDDEMHCTMIVNALMSKKYKEVRFGYCNIKEKQEFTSCFPIQQGVANETFTSRSNIPRQDAV